MGGPGISELGEDRVFDFDADRLAADHLDRKTGIAAVVLTAFFWTANFSIQTLRSILDNSPNLEGLSISRLVGTACGVVLCFALHLVIRAMRRRSFAERAVALIVVVPIAADGCAWAYYLAGLRFAPESVMATPTSSATIQAIVYWLWFLLAWAALYLALRYSWEVQASERRMRRIQALAHTAQMRALHNQINPHFMFNTLNAIAALILDGERDRSEAMVTHLADFLRATLAVDPLLDITLEEELRIQQLYLDIEQIRFPDLRVSVSHDAAALFALVPPLLLQPIVENAIKHGVAAREGAAAVAIAAHALGDRLHLEITNRSGKGAVSNGLGLGLGNVRGRLRAHYGGGNFTMTAGPSGEHDFRVSISLPLDGHRPAAAHPIPDDLARPESQPAA